MPGRKTQAQIKRAYQTLKKLRLPALGKKRQSRKPTRQGLINLESELGRAVFGATANGVRREFFYHGKNLWIYHEQKNDDDPVTITYEVRDDDVLKILPDRTSVAVSGVELRNFLAAARTYFILVQTYLYGEEPEND